MTPRTFIFIGRYGSGKGTQAKLLIESLKKLDPERKVLYIETGAEFRKFIGRKGNYTAGLTEKVVDSGGLMPEFMPINIWSNSLIENYTGNEHLVFDGTPRKLLEAEILDSVFTFYGMEKPSVIFLTLDHAESAKRLILRSAKAGRADDSAEAVLKRKTAFEKDVNPVIEWYRTNPHIRFLEVNGEGSIEEVHENILKALGLK